MVGLAAVEVRCRGKPSPAYRLDELEQSTIEMVLKTEV